MNTPNSKFLMTTAAPVAVHQCEVISVIAEELFACFGIGYTYALGIGQELDKPEGAPSNEALDRCDIAWSRIAAPNAQQTIDEVGISDDTVGVPLTVDYIAEAALDSVKSWAGDLNAFYNSELLKQMVCKLCHDWYGIGLLARHDTIGSFLIDYSVAMADALATCDQIDRS